MSDIITIKNVRAYLDENGTAWINLEDAARGLGFTRIAASGNEVVRWERVMDYLKELGFSFVPTSGHIEAYPEFIPENIFYLLAMKANNETARQFQRQVANEILPSIRKHGAYMTPATIESVLADPDNMIRLLQEIKAERELSKQKSAKIAEDAPKVLFADSVTASKSSVLVGDLAKVLCQNGCTVGRNRLFEWLRENEYLIKRGSEYNNPTQRSLEMGLFEIELGTIQRPDKDPLVTKTTKVTGKGQVYFVNCFKKMGMMP